MVALNIQNVNAWYHTILCSLASFAMYKHFNRPNQNQSVYTSTTNRVSGHSALGGQAGQRGAAFAYAILLWYSI